MKFANYVSGQEIHGASNNEAILNIIGAIYEKYEKLKTCNKNFLSGYEIQISYCGDDKPTTFEINFSYNGGGKDVKYTNSIIMMWLSYYCKDNMALPTRIVVKQNESDCENMATFFLEA